MDKIKNIENNKNKENVIKITKEDDLHEILEQVKNRLIIIMWGASWCGPCKKIKPAIANLSSIHDKSVFIYIDIEDCTVCTNGTSIIEKVERMPTFMFYINNECIKEKVGCSIDDIKKYVVRGEETIFKE